MFQINVQSIINIGRKGLCYLIKMILIKKIYIISMSSLMNLNYINVMLKNYDDILKNQINFNIYIHNLLVFLNI